MSALFPRTIQITREATASGGGVRGYSGATPTMETPVVNDLPASIQYSREGRSNPAQLPGDVFNSLWMIMFRGVAAGMVQNRDIITDDLGRRFKIVAADPTPLGYQCLCDILEA